MMANKLLGRPAGDPAKRKLVRFSLRLHPDLYSALGALADKHGLNRSVAAQHILVNAVNQSAGYELLSLHGYLVRDIPPIPATGLDRLRGFQGSLMRPRAPAPMRKKR
jgi:hypothetical protein